MQTKAKPTNLRLKQENRERLEKAQLLGFEMTEVVDGLLEKYFDNYISEAAKEKIRRMQKVLASR